MARTIAALSSGRPPAAIAVIRVSGPSAHAAALTLCHSLPPARQAAVRTLRDPSGCEVLDEALTLRFDAPRSSTGEDMVEFHCHGGRAVVDAVLAALCRGEDVREAEAGEFTRRAFENGRIDLTEAEGLADLLEAETESQRRAALSLADGGLRRQVDVWREAVLGASAIAELAIDYVGEEVEQPAMGELRGRLADLAGDIATWLDRPRVEALKDGLRVVIAGPPNVGKSSLLNALVGFERAIVADVPGTTRDHVEVPLSLGGMPLVLVDTAGLRETHDAIEAEGVARAYRLGSSADILLWLGDPEESPAHPRLVQVSAKSDLPDRPAAAPGAIAVSALQGTGLSRLWEEVLRQARAILPAEDALVLNRRQSAHLEEAAAALLDAAASEDEVIVAEHLRAAREAFDRITGRAGVEDFLEALFGRFCLGK